MDTQERLQSSLEDFLNHINDRIPVNQDTLQRMSAEEDAALAEEVLKRFASNVSETENLSTTSYDIAVDFAKSQEAPTEEIPKEEMPVSVPDYTNVREETLRFSSTEWFNKIAEKIIVLAGVGGIGSWCALLIGKLYPKALYLFDDDLVESYNMAGQFYSTEDIDQMKVDAVAKAVIKYTNFSSIFSCPRKYVYGEEIVADIMICGFDSMNARRDYYNSWKKHVLSKPESERKNCLFIDGRLSVDELQILCMTGEDDYYMKQYEQRFLFAQYESQYVICSAKQTGFLANMVASMMVNLLVNFCANETREVGHAALPFFTKYRYDTMFVDMEK